MFGAIFRSLKKSRRLRQISQHLGQCYDDGALCALINIAWYDPHMKDLLRRHKALPDALKQIYSKLIEAGAGQWQRGHWVAASSLVFGDTLAYLLHHAQDEDFDTVAYTLIIYFQEGKSGPVE